MGQSTGLECGQCTRSLEDRPRYQCRRCPHIHYCLSCSINAELLYPDHPFELARPSSRGQNIEAAERVLDTMPVGPEIIAGTASGVVESRMPEYGVGIDLPNGDSLADCPFVLPHCASCQEVLADLRYECQECHDTNFCSDCRTTHYLYHTLKVCTGPVIDPDLSSGEPDGEDAEDSSVLGDKDLDSTELETGAGDGSEADYHEPVEDTESENSAPGERKSSDDGLGSER